MTTKKLISANIFCVFICNGGPENLFSNLFKFSENPNNKSWFKVFFLAFLTHNKKNRVRYNKKNHIFVKKYFFWAPIMWGCLHPSFGLLFLVGYTRLSHSVSLSVSLSVSPSVGPSICRSVTLLKFLPKRYLNCITGQTDGWTDIWTGRRMYRRTYQQMDRQTDGQTNRWTDRWTDRQTNGRTVGHTNGWTDQQTDKASYRDAWTHLKPPKMEWALWTLIVIHCNNQKIFLANNIFGYIKILKI